MQRGGVMVVHPVLSCGVSYERSPLVLFETDTNIDIGCKWEECGDLKKGHLL